MGQARLAIQFEQDLRNQVKGFRWHGRSKKFEQPNEINNFINPNELFLTLLSNPKDNLLGTLSLLEKYNSLKRCRHLIESWGSQRLKTLENCISILIDNPSSSPSNTNKEIDDLFKDLNSDAIKFQELYYLERQHINFLDKQRCGNFIAS